MRITIRSADDTICLSDSYTDIRHIWAIKHDGVRGLFGTPSVRESPLDRPQQDGGYWPSRFTQTPRTITLDCMIRGVSTVEAANARDRINALTCQSLLIDVEDVFGVRTAECYLAADPEPLMRYRMQAFEFALVLTCPDPRWYGPVRWFETTSQSVRLPVANEGTAPSWPVIECDGPVTRLYVGYDDGLIEWAGAAESLRIDTRDMIASAGRVTTDLAFEIRPGTCRPLIRTDAKRTRIGVRPAWR